MVLCVTLLFYRALGTVSDVKREPEGGRDFPQTNTPQTSSTDTRLSYLENPAPEVFTKSFVAVILSAGRSPPPHLVEGTLHWQRRLAGSHQFEHIDRKNAVLLMVDH